MIGLPASGKTTAAKRLQLERNALRLTPDEWMIPLFAEPEANGKRDILEGRFVWLALEAIRGGTNVILDFGVWSRDERTALRVLASEVGATCELVYMRVDFDELRTRLNHRNTSDSDTTFKITDAELETFRKFFVEPDTLELSGTHLDPPPPEYQTWRDWAAQRWPTSNETGISG